VARVIIAPDSVALPRGQTMRLEAMVVDRSGSALDGRDIRWASSDAMRVTVTSAGVVSAVAVGSSLVSATSEGKADTVKVIVTS
jgi:trimeric autotransporter adhesin